MERVYIPKGPPNPDTYAVRFQEADNLLGLGFKVVAMLQELRLMILNPAFPIIRNLP